MHLPPEFKNKVIILGVKIDDVSLTEAINKIELFLNSEQQHLIFTPNPEICLRASRDNDYRHALNDASLNLPDGIGLQFGAKILQQALKNRITGADITPKLLALAQSKLLKVYIIRREDSLSSETDIKTIMKKKFPRLIGQVGTISTKPNANHDALLNAINDFAPAILFLTLGAPQQEIWAKQYLKLLPSVKVAIAVGGAFDFLTDKIKRAPNVIRDLGLEWLYRLYQEPKRLRRIKNATADFLLACHQWQKRTENEFRPNILAVIKNQQNQFLIAKSKRFPNHWQFPQGGIEKGEEMEQAVLREVHEEIGCPAKALKIIQRLPETYRYLWPRYSQLLKGYKGQQQTAFLLEFSGGTADINIEKSQEVIDYQWIEKDEILRLLHRDRQHFAKIILPYLSPSFRTRSGI